MRLTRQVVNGEVIFRNSETGEIVKKEPLNLKSHPTTKHTSALGTIISIVGVLCLLVSIVMFVFSTQSLASAFVAPLAVILFVSSIALFALAEIVHNSQLQSKLLQQILHNTEKEITTN